jgi:hypothetical protein
MSCDFPAPTSGSRYGIPGQPLPTQHSPARPDETRMNW